MLGIAAETVTMSYPVFPLIPPYSVSESSSCAFRSIVNT